MKLRYELKDRDNTSTRGERYTSLDRASKKIADCRAWNGDRFFVWDRLEKREVKRGYSKG